MNNRPASDEPDHGESAHYRPSPFRPTSWAVLVLRVDRRPGAHGAPGRPSRSDDVPAVRPVGSQGSMGARGPWQDRIPREDEGSAPTTPARRDPARLASAPCPRTTGSLAGQALAVDAQFDQEMHPCAAGCAFQEPPDLPRLARSRGNVCLPVATSAERGRRGTGIETRVAQMARPPTARWVVTDAPGRLDEQR